MRPTVATYNVHGCLGADGREDHARTLGVLRAAGHYGNALLTRLPGRIEVHKGVPAKIASDHLPLRATLALN